MSFVGGYCGRKGGRATVPNDLVEIRTGNGEIYTGYYADLFSLSKSDQEKVRDERKRFGHTAKGLVKNAKKTAGMLVKAIKSTKAKLKAQTITISDMKSKFDTKTDDPVTDDVGCSLGGQKEKNKAKKIMTNHDSDEE